MDLVAELTWVADRTYGPDWEEQGRSQLARRAAALLLLLLGGVAGAAGGSFAATLLGSMARRKKTVIAGAAVGIFAVIAVTTTTLALTGNNTTATLSSPGSRSSVTGAATTNPATGGAPATSSSAKPKPSKGPSPTATPTTSPPATATPTTTAPTTAPPTTGPPTTAPATNPATTAAPPAPVIAALASSPATVSGTCPAALPALTVPGTISSNRATTVTYHWTRSNQTSSGSAQVAIPAGGTVSVPDFVTAASNNWEISDTLTVTSPSGHSASAKAAVQCAYPTLTLTQPATQFPAIGQAFKLSLPPSGGSGPYNWSASNLPPGLSIGGGVISGTPTTEGRFTVAVTDTEATPQSASVSFTIDPLFT